MTDFEYDNWQKKILAKNATKRKCGAKSKKCTLPSDYLTNKQIRERNGKIVSFNLNAPMAWSQYITLPDDIKKEYILTLRKKYNANQIVLSEMFGRGKSTISMEMKRLNLRLGREVRMTSTEIHEFRKWVAGDIEEPMKKEEAPIKYEPVLEEPMKKEEAPIKCEPVLDEPKKSLEVHIISGQLSFTGSAVNVCEALFSVIKDMPGVLKLTATFEEFSE